MAHVTEFVCGAPQSTFFSRLAWSPDGQVSGGEGEVGGEWERV